MFGDQIFKDHNLFSGYKIYIDWEIIIPIEY